MIFLGSATKLQAELRLRSYMYDSGFFFFCKALRSLNEIPEPPAYFYIVLLIQKLFISQTHQGEMYCKLNIAHARGHLLSTSGPLGYNESVMLHSRCVFSSQCEVNGFLLAFVSRHAYIHRMTTHPPKQNPRTHTFKSKC